MLGISIDRRDRSTALKLFDYRGGRLPKFHCRLIVGLFYVVYWKVKNTAPLRRTTMF